MGAHLLLSQSEQFGRSHWGGGCSSEPIVSVSGLDSMDFTKNLIAVILIRLLKSAAFSPSYYWWKNPEDIMHQGRASQGGFG